MIKGFVEFVREMSEAEGVFATITVVMVLVCFLVLMVALAFVLPLMFAVMMACAFVATLLVWACLAGGNRNG